MSDAESETWAPVPGYEGLYEVSDQGRVRSIDRDVHTSLKGQEARHIEGKTLTQEEGARVQLWRDGTPEKASVARLVLLVHGPEPESPTRHAKYIDPDGGPCLENLRWVRPIHKSKLTEKEAARIYRWAWETSMTNQEVGQHFRVSRQTVSNIKHGYTWSHVTDEITVDKS
jgi:hypothetical protein